MLHFLPISEWRDQIPCGADELEVLHFFVLCLSFLSLNPAKRELHQCQFVGHHKTPDLSHSSPLIGATVTSFHSWHTVHTVHVPILANYAKRHRCIKGTWFRTPRWRLLIPVKVSHAARMPRVISLPGSVLFCPLNMNWPEPGSPADLTSEKSQSCKVSKKKVSSTGTNKILVCFPAHILYIGVMSRT